MAYKTYLKIYIQFYLVTVLSAVYLRPWTRTQGVVQSKFLMYCFQFKTNLFFLEIVTMKSNKVKWDMENNWNVDNSRNWTQFP